MKKYVAGIASTIVLGTLAVGCGTQAGGSGNSTNQSKQNANLTLAWWTSTLRTQETNTAINMFEKANPGIKVTPDYTSWDSYWTKLTTQIAGGQTPDVIQMDESEIVEYAHNNTITDLRKAGVDLAGLDKKSLSLGKVDGTLYGVPTGVNAFALLYDPTLLKQSHVSIDPSRSMSWDSFAKLLVQIHQADPKIYGAQDGIEYLALLEYYARDNGDQLFSSDGKSLGISKQVMTNWFNYWKSLEANGGVPPASFTSSYSYSDMQDNPIVKGMSVFAWAWSNQLEAFDQTANKNLEMVMLPDYNSPSKPYYLHPSMYWSISSTSKNTAAAVKLVNFLENNSKVAQTFKNDRGVPINESNRETLRKSSSATDKDQIDFINQVEKIASSDSVEAPAYGQIQDLLVNVAQQVMLNKTSPSAAATSFIAQANQDLQQSN
ncbi:ABC transporter substrate-binding protein [Alicyclobacillus suci]|uniref:ABC transporter substrate-binding protein n=1 Tax=Alicyclobacillus suci TaxID=2816080 RepID=UPI001A8DD0D8|nr:ABC transporter substrate-binding protein [Alicyclobacillus suci]